MAYGQVLFFNFSQSDALRCQPRPPHLDTPVASSARSGGTSGGPAFAVMVVAFGDGYELDRSTQYYYRNLPKSPAHRSPEKEAPRLGR